MRRQLVRSTFAAVLLSVGIVVLPLGIAVWWAGAGDFRRLREWLGGNPRLLRAPVLLLGLIVVLSVIAVIAGMLVASLQARRFSEPMTQLVDRAERLGAGGAQLQPLGPRIRAVDRGSAAA